MSDRSLRLGRLFVVIIVLVTLTGGASYWLKRVGWVESERYAVLVAERRALMAPRNGPADQGEWSAEAYGRMVSDYWANKRRIGDFLAANQEIGFALRIANDLVLVAFVLTSLVLIRWRSGRGPPSVDNLAFAGLVLLTGVMALVSWYRFGPLFALGGAYSVIVIAVALLGGWFSTRDNLRWLAIGLMALVLLQLVMAPVELVRGLPQFGRSGTLYGERMVGVFKQPSTLGIFTAVVWAFFAFFACFAGPAARIWSGLAALAVVLFSASATALAAMATTAVLLAWPHVSKWLLAGVAGGVILVLLFAAWPQGQGLSIGEFWVSSLGGRLDQYVDHFGRGFGWVEYLLGRGLGAGTNATLLLAQWSDPRLPEMVGLLQSTNSTPLMLMMQLGLTGCVVFYWLLLRAAWIRREFRPVYAAVLVASLGTNIPEHFPVAFVLGVLWAYHRVHPQPVRDGYAGRNKELAKTGDRAEMDMSDIGPGLGDCRSRLSA